MAAEFVPFEFPKEMRTQEPVTEDVKSKALADKYRKEANDVYLYKRQLIKALELYNRSLCCSVPGSAEMGLVYSSRAQLYHDAHMYTRSLENVALARQYELTADQRTRLEKREKLCQEALRNNLEHDIRNNFYKLSRPGHRMYPQVVDCLEIVESAEWGRHVVTKKDLDVGEVICLEDPISVCPKASGYLFRCCYCLTSNNYSLIPCPGCTSGLFQSRFHCLRSDVASFSPRSDVLFAGVFGQ